MVTNKVDTDKSVVITTDLSDSIAVDQKINNSDFKVEEDRHGNKNVSKSRTSVNDKNIEKKTPTKPKNYKRVFSSAQSVLACEGVLHTHVNPEVVGSSRAEDHMTRCAMQDVFELKSNTQAPALMCQPLSQEKGDVTKTAEDPRKCEAAHNKSRCVKSGSFKLLVGQTPPAIIRLVCFQL